MSTLIQTMQTMEPIIKTVGPIEVIRTPQLLVIYRAVMRELAENGFTTWGRLIYVARYHYCEERLWRRVQQAEKEFAEGKVIHADSMMDLLK
jgi:hypothetical protein